MSEVVRIIQKIEAGDIHSADELLPLVYNELKTMASRRLAKDGKQSLQTTELVHEVYLRLVGPDQNWNGRAHFFGAAAEAMRRILVDRARQRHAEKRGSNYERVELHDSAIAGGFQPHEVLIVDDLFDRLAEKHPVEAEIAKLRYFVGFNHRETVPTPRCFRRGLPPRCRRLFPDFRYQHFHTLSSHPTHRRRHRSHL